MRHSLSNIDDEKRTAVCAVCGPVNIGILNRPTRVERYCRNKRAEITGRHYRKYHPEVKAVRGRSEEEKRQRSKEQHAAYYQANRERLLAQMAVRYSAKREEELAGHRAYYQANSERIKRNARAWAEANPERRKASEVRRKNRLNSQMSQEDIELSVAYRKTIKDDPCYYCGVQSEAMHDDHLIPLAKGGTDHWFNLVRACQRCNCRKRDRMPGEFLAILKAG